jgi:hypothetical protein
MSWKITVGAVATLFLLMLDPFLIESLPKLTRIDMRTPPF